MEYFRCLREDLLADSKDSGVEEFVVESCFVINLSELMDQK